LIERAVDDNTVSDLFPVCCNFAHVDRSIRGCHELQYRGIRARGQITTTTLLVMILNK